MGQEEGTGKTGVGAKGWDDVIVNEGGEFGAGHFTNKSVHNQVGNFSTFVPGRIRDQGGGGGMSGKVKRLLHYGDKRIS